MHQATYGDVVFAACLLWLGNPSWDATSPIWGVELVNAPSKICPGNKFTHECMFMRPCHCLKDVWAINDHAEAF